MKHILKVNSRKISFTTEKIRIFKTFTKKYQFYDGTTFFDTTFFLKKCSNTEKNTIFQ